MGVSSGVIKRHNPRKPSHKIPILWPGGVARMLVRCAQVSTLRARNYGFFVIAQIKNGGKPRKKKQFKMATVKSIKLKALKA